MDRKNKKTRSKVFTQGQSVGNQNNMVKINSPNYNKGKYIQNSDPMSIKPDFGPNCGGDLLWCEMHGECISQSDFDAGYCCDEAGNCQGDILSLPSQGYNGEYRDHQEFGEQGWMQGICFTTCGAADPTDNSWQCGGGCEAGNTVWCDCCDGLNYPGTNSGVDCDGGGEVQTKGCCFGTRMGRPVFKNNSDAALCAALALGQDMGPTTFTPGFNCGQCDEDGTNCSLCYGTVCLPKCAGDTPYSEFAQCYNNPDGSGGPASNTNICCDPATGFCSGDYGYIGSPCPPHSYCVADGTACTIPCTEPGCYCSVWYDPYAQEQCTDLKLENNNTECTSISNCSYWQDKWGGCWSADTWTGESCHWTCDVFSTAQACEMYGNVPGAEGRTANEMCCYCGGGNSGSCVGNCGGSISGCWCDDQCAGLGDCCFDVCEVCDVSCGDWEYPPRIWWEGYWDCAFDPNDDPEGINGGANQCLPRAHLGDWTWWIEDDLPINCGMGGSNCDDSGQFFTNCEAFDYDCGGCGDGVGCVNDDSTADDYNDYCSYGETGTGGGYDDYPSWCGNYDTDTFCSLTQCCICGGGSTGNNTACADSPAGCTGGCINAGGQDYDCCAGCNCSCYGSIISNTCSEGNGGGCSYPCEYVSECGGACTNIFQPTCGVC